MEDKGINYWWYIERDDYRNLYLYNDKWVRKWVSKLRVSHLEHAIWNPDREDGKWMIDINSLPGPLRILGDGR